jgi:hypothetical protein
MSDVVAMLEEWEAENARVKPAFEVREAAMKCAKRRSAATPMFR